MKNILIVSLILISIFANWSCKKKSNESSQATEKELIISELDSNYVLEDILALKTFEAIEKKFGKTNLKKDSLIAGPEGTTINVSILFPKNKEEVKLYWAEKEKFDLLKDVVINCDSTGYNGKWHSKSGLQAGQNLDKVLALNGKAFTISGFGWDYGGHIVSWEGGKLDNQRLTGRFSDYAQNKITDAAYQSISGDTEFNVSLEAIKKLNPVLTELRVFKK